MKIIREIMSNDSENLLSLFGSVEGVEQHLNIEYSCGDGKWIQDLDINFIEVCKYDGEVDWNIFRSKSTGEVFNTPVLLKLVLDDDPHNSDFVISCSIVKKNKKCF